MSWLRYDGELFRRLAYWGARYSPSLWLRASPTFFGLLFAVVLPQKRALVRGNLRRILGSRVWWEEQVDVLDTFVRYAHCLAEGLASERPEAEGARLRCRGEHFLREALGGRKGAVLVTAHTGAWDVAARSLHTTECLDVILVMEPERDPSAGGYHDEYRQRVGSKVVHVRHPLDSLVLLRQLRRGAVVALQMDRVPPDLRSVETRLFGEPFRVPEGPFLLAAAAGAPVLPAFSRRVGYFDCEVVLGPPHWLPKRLEPGMMERTAQSVVQELERFLRANPTHWFHFDER